VFLFLAHSYKTLSSRVIYAFINKQLISFQNFWGRFILPLKMFTHFECLGGRHKAMKRETFSREVGVERACLEYHCYLASSLMLFLKKISVAL